MAGFMRKMIEDMMGQEALDGNTHVAITYDNPRVCRGFLEGLCLHELFVNTKLDRGDCDKIHSQKLKDEYEKAKLEGKEANVIEIDLERQLSAFVSDCDRRIRSAQDRVAQDPTPGKTIQLNQEIEDLENEIQKLSQEAENLGEEGEVDKAMEVMKKIDDIKAKKEEKETEMKTMTAHDMSTNQRMRVCEVCGAYLASSDEDKRIADHFVGKMHVGYQKIRALLATLQARLQEYRRKSSSRKRYSTSSSYRSPSPSDYHRSYRHRPSSRDYRRSRRSSSTSSEERYYDRYGSSRYSHSRRHLPSSRERSRDRYRRRSKSRSRSRSRSRSHSKDYLSHRHRHHRHSSPVSSSSSSFSSSHHRSHHQHHHHHHGAPRSRYSDASMASSRHSLTSLSQSHQSRSTSNRRKSRSRSRSRGHPHENHNDLTSSSMTLKSTPSISSHELNPIVVSSTDSSKLNNEGKKSSLNFVSESMEKIESERDREKEKEEGEL